MDTRHEAAGVDRERRAALLLGLAGMSAVVVGQGREAFAQQTSAAGRQDVRQAVEAFVTKYLDAYNKKDAAGVAALYTEDGFLVPPGPITTGKQNIEKAWRAVFDAGRTGLATTSSRCRRKETSCGRSASSRSWRRTRAACCRSARATSPTSTNGKVMG